VKLKDSHEFVAKQTRRKLLYLNFQNLRTKLLTNFPNHEESSPKLQIFDGGIPCNKMLFKSNESVNNISIIIQPLMPV